MKIRYLKRLILYSIILSTIFLVLIFTFPSLESVSAVILRNWLTKVANMTVPPDQKNFYNKITFYFYAYDPIHLSDLHFYKVINLKDKNISINSKYDCQWIKSSANKELFVNRIHIFPKKFRQIYHFKFECPNKITQLDELKNGELPSYAGSFGKY